MRFITGVVRLKIALYLLFLTVKSSNTLKISIDDEEEFWIRTIGLGSITASPTKRRTSPPTRE